MPQNQMRKIIKICSEIADSFWSMLDVAETWNKYYFHIAIIAACFADLMLSCKTDDDEQLVFETETEVNLHYDNKILSTEANISLFSLLYSAFKVDYISFNVKSDFAQISFEDGGKEFGQFGVYHSYQQLLETRT